MTLLVVPPIDDELYPSLGDQVAEWMEEHLVFGPGDLRGQDYRLDDEKRALLIRMYEVYPQGHPQEGRRRFRRVAISLRKGSAKTEFAAAIAAAELHYAAPVRFNGFRRNGLLERGASVIDPYIPLVAYTAEQSEDLAYGALLVMIGEGPLAQDFDVGLERIMRKDGDGKAVPLASAPSARDGARTTFEHFDETHRFVLPRLRQAHRTMLANLPKRRLADPWALETTTAPAPGEGSVAETTMDYARSVAAGQRQDSRLFFFHRQASEKRELKSREEIRAAVVEASGPVAEWSDIEGIVDQWDDPTADRTYLDRVWLNRLVRSADRAFEMERWKELAETDHVVPPRAWITLGFDGARFWDSTALVATEVSTGYQWSLGLWERPPRVEEWEVPVDEVDAAVQLAFSTWRVWRLNADPPRWETHIREWAGKWPDQVVEWFTIRQRQMGLAVQAYAGAIVAGEVKHADDPLLTAHLGNAVRRTLPMLDDLGKPLWTIQKERDDSPLKIDEAVAAILSWDARTRALAAGVLTQQEEWSFGAV